MNNLVLLAVAVAVATATFSSVTALSVLGFCPHPGMIRFSHPVQYWNFNHPHFRHFKRIESSDTFENGVHDAENVFHLIKSLPNDCYTYDDEKYTYEYCHMESVRQLGLKAQNNLREEYNLGRYCPQRSLQKYSPLLRMAKINLMDGEPCGDGAIRKTKVKFFCSNPKLSMHIISAREKSLCNYRILVHVPELCFK